MRRPFFPCQKVDVADADFVHQRNRHFFAGMMVCKAQFLLHSLGLGVSFIVCAPNGGHAERFKPIAQKRFRCFRHVSPAPKRLSQPIAQITLVRFIAQIRMSVLPKLDGTNRPFAVLFAYRIALRAVQHISNRIQAFGIRFHSAAQYQSVRFQIHKTAPFSCAFDCYYTITKIQKSNRFFFRLDRLD